MAVVGALKDKKDLELMKAVLKSKNVRDYFMFILGCNTGLRIGDLLELKVSDILNDKGAYNKYIVVREQKTGKERKIAINNAIIKAFNKFHETYKLQLNDFLFTSRKGSNGHISTTQAYRILNAAARECKIEINFGCHTLRKTFGFHVYEATGKNLALVMDILNHSSPAITLRYLGITQDQKDRAYMAVEI